MSSSERSTLIEVRRTPLAVSSLSPSAYLDVLEPTITVDGNTSTPAAPSRIQTKLGVAVSDAEALALQNASKLYNSMAQESWKNAKGRLVQLPADDQQTQWQQIMKGNLSVVKSMCPTCSIQGWLEAEGTAHG